MGKDPAALGVHPSLASPCVGLHHPRLVRVLPRFAGSEAVQAAFRASRVPADADPASAARPSGTTADRVIEKRRQKQLAELSARIGRLRGQVLYLQQEEHLAARLL